MLMATSDVLKTTPFTHTWTIENIPIKTCINVESPLFIAHPISRAKLYIHVHLSPSCLWCFLLPEDPTQGMPSMVEVEFSLLASDGSQIISRGNKEKNFLVSMVNREEFLERINEFLPNNKLTVQCRMWKKRYFFWKNCSDFCHIKTIFLMHEESFMWPVEKFSALKSCIAKSFTSLALDERKVYPLKPFNPDGPFMALVLYLKRNPASEDVCVDVLISKDKNCSFSLEISVLDANAVVIASKMRETRSYFAREITDFISIISKNQLTANKDLILPNDTLLLKCSFKIFTGVISNKIEYCSQNVSISVKDEEKVSDKDLDHDDSFPFDEYFRTQADINVTSENRVEENKGSESCINNCSLKSILKHLRSCTEKHLSKGPH